MSQNAQRQELDKPLVGSVRTYPEGQGEEALTKGWAGEGVDFDFTE